MSDSDELGELDDLYNQGLLTDEERQRAMDRLAAREQRGGARRRLPRLISLWPIAALLVGVGLIIFAVLGTGGGKSTKTTAGIEVSGNVVILVSDNSALPDDPTVPQGATFNVTAPGYGVGKGCHTVTAGGFQDIASGAPVVINSSDGTKLATTALKPGVYDTNADCVFGFTAAVVKTASYSIRIAQRNPVPFSQKEIASPQLIL